MRKFVELPMQWIQILQLLDPTMKVHFGNSSSISDSLEHS